MEWRAPLFSVASSRSELLLFDYAKHVCVMLEGRAIIVKSLFVAFHSYCNAILRRLLCSIVLDVLTLHFFFSFSDLLAIHLKTGTEARYLSNLGPRPPCFQNVSSLKISPSTGVPYPESSPLPPCTPVPCTSMKLLAT